MSVSNYYLIGPIAANSATIFTYDSGGVAYFLTLVKGSNDGPDELIFDPRPSGDDNTIAAPLVITPISSGTGNSAFCSLSYVDSNNDTVYITGTQGYAGPSTSPVSLTIQQNTVNPWPNVPFLAGVNYKFAFGNNNTIQWKTYIADQSEDGMATSIKTNNGDPVINNYSGGVRVISSPWYQGGGGCGTTTGLASLVQLEEDWVAGNPSASGFTTLEDCQVGVQYSYCPPQQTCGASCRGPCPNANSNIGCFFDSSSNEFKCEEDPFNEPWYKQPWFVYGLIIFIVVIVVLFLLLLVRFSDKKQ